MDLNHQHLRCKRNALPIELITFNIYYFGIKGFEPLNTRTKNEGLSAWLYPNKKVLTKLFKNYFEIPMAIKTKTSCTLGTTLMIR